MQEKSHYKLFKAGKNWCTMMITLVAVAAGVSLASTNVHADVAPQTVSTTTLTSSPQNGQVNAGNNNSNSGDQVKDNSSERADQQTNVDYKTPVNAGYIDTVTADTDNANTIDVSGWHATNQYQPGMNHYLIALNGDNNQELYRGKVEPKFQE